jgi:hypothetical protein
MQHTSNPTERSDSQRVACLRCGASVEVTRTLSRVTLNYDVDDWRLSASPRYCEDARYSLTTSLQVGDATCCICCENMADNLRADG